MPAISVLMKPSSSMCNMSCDYCFYCDEAQKRNQKSYGFMSEYTLKNIIRKTMLRAERMISYAYQGGEPTLRGLEFFEKAVAYQKQYNRNQIQVTNALQTNGYSITEDWCSFFKENNFLIGLSVDGTPDIHNTFRHDKKRGATYARVNHAAELMDRYGVDYNILTYVTPLVAGNITDIYTAYRKRGWNYQQYIPCLDPLYEGHENTPYALTPEVYGQFLIDLFFLWYRDLKHQKQPYIRQFENYISLAAGYMAESCDQRGVCGIQNVAEADGSIYPCDFYMLDEYRLGNFNEDRLDQINERRKEIRFIERSRMVDEACHECRYYRLCRGGCQRSRDYNPADGTYKSYFCKSFQMFFEKYYDTIMNIGRQISSRM